MENENTNPEQQQPQQVVVSAEQLDLWNRLLMAMSTTVRDLRSDVAAHEQKSIAHEQRIASLEDMLLKLTSNPEERNPPDRAKMN